MNQESDPARRMSLPGRRPKDKKKNNDKKNIDVPSLDDIMFQEKQQNKDQDNWSLTSAGDLGSVHIKTMKPTLSLCTQLQDKKSQESHIPLLLKDIYLEEKPGYDDKTNVDTQTKECKQKVVLDDLNISSLETEKQCLFGGGSELEGHLVTPVIENRDSEKPDLKAVLEEVDHKKEQKEGDDHINVLLDGMPCKKELNQGHQDVPFEDLQVSRELEFNSMLTANEKMMQEEQSANNDTEGVTSSQELLNQPVLHDEEEKCVGQQEFATDVIHNREKQIRGSKLDSLSEGDTNQEDQNVQDQPNNEPQKPAELKYPDILSTMCESQEEKKAGVQRHLHTVTEASSTSLEQNCINLLDQKNQHPVIPQTLDFSCQSMSCEKQQKEIVTTRSSASNIAFINVEDHQYILHHVHQQTAMPENIILPQDETSTKEFQILDNINYLPEDNADHVSEQKHPEIQQLISLEQISTHHHGALEYAHSGCKGTSYNEEEETQESIVSEDLTKLPGSINFEREQQRKLDCGDSGLEGVCEKEEQDCQDALGLEVQQPIIISKLTTLPLNTSEEMPYDKKDNLTAGSFDTHSLDEDPEEQDGWSQMHVLASSKEEPAALEPDEKELTLSLLTEENKEGEQVESGHIPKGVSIPHDEQPRKVELNVDLSSEKQQQKEKQDLSNVAFTGGVVQDETLI